METLRRLFDQILDLFLPILQLVISHWVVALIIISVLIYWASGGRKGN